MPPDKNAAARQMAQNLTEDELCNYVDSLAYQDGNCIYRPAPGKPGLFIKYGFKALCAEGRMQQLAFEFLRKAHTTTPPTLTNIHVPEVFSIFTKGEEAGFTIMELVDGVEAEEYMKKLKLDYAEPRTPLYDLIAHGVLSLCNVPVPPDAYPGPYLYTNAENTRVKSRIRHMIFQDFHSPRVFQTIQEPEEFLNAIGKWRAQTNPGVLTSVQLEKELTFCYTDFNEANFMLSAGADGRTHLHIVDFGHASFLPLSLMAYVVF
ncbi:hypothetical protein B0H63DRAFT_513596 [Podospora didyma]|uniref:Aminoglycoside phosphotransferase domain-containing protein n=1 Tax=Podospora didyma TaxID=330526 RepID=A0AAE0N0N5_9PEZI|nr:hypothetical protein B0H63DRAFT_515824 [Podospora didyma]KAK3366357.1 hypothetical protein B0H63DRAFT_515820 [Podospora didyma]KAK3372093.1 hypothetical protein B0H63DRAFT_513596 [Podospora didyma]